MNNKSDFKGCLEIILGIVFLCTIPYSLFLLIPLFIIGYTIYFYKKFFGKNNHNNYKEESKNRLDIASVKNEKDKNIRNVAESDYSIDKKVVKDLSSNISNDDIDIFEDNWTDDYGVVYSRDKTILEYYSPNLDWKEYKVIDGCKRIKSYSFNAELDEIHSECIEIIRCSNSLRIITLPESVEFIEEHAFEGCDMLKAIVVPINTISYFCKLLPLYKDILVEQINDNESPLSTKVLEKDFCKGWEDEFGIKYSSDKKRLLKAPKGIVLDKYIVREGTLVICDSAFQKCNIRELILPSTLCKIGALAFANNAIINQLTIPSNVYHIETSNFIGGCFSLNNLTIKTDALLFDKGLLYSSDYRILYSHISNEKRNSIEIDNRVEIIASCCFWEHKELLSIILPNGLKNIGASAFYGCKNLTKIEIPSEVEHIGSRAFSTSGIKEIDCQSNKFIVDSHILYDRAKERLLYNFSNDKIISISSSVKYIGKSAFENNKIISVKLPLGLKHIDDDAFYRCKSLNEINIPQSVLTIGDSVFGFCPIEEITIPQFVNKIGKDCFYFCGMLKRIIIKSELKSIEGILSCAGQHHNSDIEIQYPVGCFYQFYSCIYNNDRTILLYCKNETEVKILETATRIGQGAFSCNRTIKKIIIPSYVKSIGRYAFMTSSIEEVIFCSRDIIIEEYSFSMCRKLRKIVVPNGSKEYFDRKLFDFRDIIIEEKWIPQHIAINTAYAQALNNCRNIDFGWIKQYANSNYPNILLDNRGIKPLTDEDELNQYLYSYGNMHYAKNHDAIRYLPLALWGENLHIIDWGCGQGIASFTFLTKRKTSSVAVTLIEPSLPALKRAALNIKQAHNNYSKGIFKCQTICKDFDSLIPKDLCSEGASFKIHFFSNVLDIEEGYSISKLVELIKSTQKGINYFVCVSPYQNEEKKKRLNSFVNAFANCNNFILRCSVDSKREDELWKCNNLYKGYYPGEYCMGTCDNCDKKWTRIIRVFSVNL